MIADSAHKINIILGVEDNCICWSVLHMVYMNWEKETWGNKQSATVISC